ncbi:hypothetical protein DFJ73DRAFT_417424 [Zopfochytrium polystomum]|nr:hypothetical protein DFJ73DRAFT_417424 [Zopfochytrium polystomum]
MKFSLVVALCVLVLDSLAAAQIHGPHQEEDRAVVERRGGPTVSSSTPSGASKGTLPPNSLLSSTATTKRVSVSSASTASTTPTAAQTACKPFTNVMTIMLNAADANDVMSEFYFGKILPTTGYVLRKMVRPGSGTASGWSNLVAAITSSSPDSADIRSMEPSLTGKVPSIAKPSIINSFESSRISWKVYMEAYPPKPASCMTSVTYVDNSTNLTYSAQDNPFIALQYVRTNQTLCSKIVALSQLKIDIDKNVVPSFAYVVPGHVVGGRSMTIVEVAAWVKRFLEPKLESPAFAKTLFFIIFSSARTNGVPSYGIMLGKGVTKKGAIDYSSYTLSSWVRTLLTGFGISQSPSLDVPFIPLSC